MTGGRPFSNGITQSARYVKAALGERPDLAQADERHNASRQHRETHLHRSSFGGLEGDVEPLIAIDGSTHQLSELLEPRIVDDAQRSFTESNLTR